MALASLLIAPGSAELAGKRLLLFSFGTYPPECSERLAYRTHGLFPHYPTGMRAC